MKATLKLINSYYIRGFFGPFFTIIFPILLLFILGNAMSDSAIKSGTPIKVMQNLVAGVTVSTIISNGLMGLPTTIIEFKKSTLIKRIGAAHISKKSFFTATIIYQIFWSLFSFLWVLLWAGIIIGTQPDFSWEVAFSKNFFITLPFIFLTMLVSISMGLLIIGLVNTQQGVMGITNVIYLPISFLSGSFMPKAQIDSSETLSIISYMLPTKYVVDPFFTAFESGVSGLNDAGWESWGFPLIAIAFSLICILVTIKKFKWSH